MMIVVENTGVRNALFASTTLATTTPLDGPPGSFRRSTDKAIDVVLQSMKAG